MINNLEFHHGISHDLDIAWLTSLPQTTQLLVGDGEKTRFRLKHEARFLGSFTWAWVINHAAIDAIFNQDFSTQSIRRMLYGNEVWHQYDLDKDDSRYVVVTPALLDGQVGLVEYHYIEELK